MVVVVVVVVFVVVVVVVVVVVAAAAAAVALLLFCCCYIMLLMLQPLMLVLQMDFRLQILIRYIVYLQDAGPVSFSRRRASFSQNVFNFAQPYPTQDVSRSLERSRRKVNSRRSKRWIE